MKIAAIALNTWRETVRDRLLAAVLGCLVVLLALVFMLETNLHAAAASILDMSLTLASGLGAFVAIFLGTSLVHKELDKKTVFTVLSKPISRFQFLAGKYLGLVVTLAAVVLVIAAGLALVMLGVGHFQPQVFALCLALWVELAVLTAMALCFSTMTNGTLAALYTFGLYLVGQNVTLVRDFADSEVRLSKFTYYGGHAIYCLLPHFEPFDFKNLVLYGGSLPWTAWGWGLAYGAMVALAFLSLAAFAWESRELL